MQAPVGAEASRMTKMNPEIKKQWLKGLESGEYEQGENALRIGGEFCCLGVLCDIVEPGAWIDYAEERGETKYAIEDGTNNYEEDTLPTHIREKAGLDRSDPRVPLTKAELKLIRRSTRLPEHRRAMIKASGTCLSLLNDSGLFNFKQIAAKIRKHL